MKEQMCGDGYVGQAQCCGSIHEVCDSKYYTGKDVGLVGPADHPEKDWREMYVELQSYVVELNTMHNRHVDSLVRGFTKVMDEYREEMAAKLEAGFDEAYEEIRAAKNKARQLQRSLDFYESKSCCSEKDDPECEAECKTQAVVQEKCDWPGKQPKLRDPGRNVVGGRRAGGGMGKRSY